MARSRLPLRDPRTIARDIPGVLDVLFPRLTGGLVASLNRSIFSFKNIDPIPDNLLEQSGLQNAMIFEISVARAELILSGASDPSWKACLDIAIERQRRHYDAKIPDALLPAEVVVAEHAANNLVRMLNSLKIQYSGFKIELKPKIPGFGWISSGSGDFSIGDTLVEVKHTDRNFISADFRQILMYWMLRYAASIETSQPV